MITDSSSTTSYLGPCAGTLFGSHFRESVSPVLDHNLLSYGTCHSHFHVLRCHSRADDQLLPSLLPSRMTRSLKRAPVLLVLLLPIVTFIIIGRTVEIARDRITYPEVNEVERRALTDVVTTTIGLAGTSSAGAGLSRSSTTTPNTL